MEKYAKQIHADDNVATAVSDCVAGESLTVQFGGQTATYACKQNVPFGHKIAIRDIPTGGSVVKYGEVIGSATADIAVGEWVHTHNVRDDYKCLGKDGAPLPGQEEGKACASRGEGS